MQLAQAAVAVRRGIRAHLAEMLEQGAAVTELVAAAKEGATSHAVPEAEMVVLVWDTLIDAADVRPE